MANVLGKAIPARSRLLTGCALASAMFASANAPHALAASANPGTSFQGNIQSVPLGAATFQSRSGVQDTINISAAQTVINWSTFDTATGGGPITFLASPATALFRNDPASQITNFTVLNRILPTDATRAVRFDGTVRSQVNGQNGGSVWFYTPGGIILGPTATFDVGNLVLSAADIDTADNSLFGTNGTIRFRAATDSNAAVDINAGARILASTPGSYVALVAPRITQSGTVNVNGSVGYIAAEQVDVRINNGLFDIEFLQGTGASATPIIHDGVTTGPGPDANSSFQRIYLAAYPKNDAITLLVTGGLGFGAADTAFVDRGQVVLSAGRSVLDLGLTSGTGLAPSTTVADVRIGTDTNADLTFTSGVIASASHDVIISPRTGFKLDFQRGLSVSAGHVAEVGSGNNETILIGSDLFLNSANVGTGANASLYALGTPNSNAPRGEVDIAGALFVFGGRSTAAGAQTAIANITVDGGVLNVGSFTNVDASDQGFSQRPTVGGIASVNVNNGGTFSAGNSLQIRADGRSSGFDTDNALAGTARLSVQDGTLTTNDLILSAAAVSGNGASATGGIASVSVRNASTLNLGNLFIGANAAVGGEGGTSPGGSLGPSSGNAPSAPATGLLTGGSASLTVENTVLNIGTLTLSGSADGSFGSAGSDAVGGSASLDVISGTVISESLSLVASAMAERGRQADDETTPVTAATPGGNAMGGTARLTVSGGNVEATQTLLDAIGTGGNGGGGSTTQAAASGGTGRGGTAEALQTGGSVATQLLTVNSGARGGSGGSASSGFDGGTGGSGTGGISRLTLGSGGLFDFLDVDNGITTIQVNLDSTGAGGLGGDQFGTANGGAGGAGIGGTTSASLSGIFATSALATGQIVNLVSEGFGGTGGNILAFGTGAAQQVGGVGGAGTGGAATVTLSRLNTNISSLSVFADSSGGGGGSRSGSFALTGIGGLGGAASGGIANVTITANSNITDLAVDASASGGFGGTATTGGNGGSALNTGIAALNVLNSTASIANVNITSSAFGSVGGIGQAGNSGAGGNARGGTSLITTSGTVDANGNPVTFGNLFITNLAIASDATGGDGVIPSTFGSGNGGGGGDATGGSSTVRARDVGQIAISNVADVSAFASGGRAAAGSSNSVPGNGGVGGNATGGTSLIDNISGLISAQNLSLDSDGDGGSGGAGGETGYGVNGQGGKGGSGTGGIALANNIEISGIGASAFVSASGSGGQAGSGAVGGAGGLGKGGTASLSLLGSATSLRQLSVTATAFGADGGFSSVGIGANGGGAIGGTATAIVGGTSNGLNISTVSVDSSASGGTGSAGGDAQSGGSGGDAVAGDASFTIAAGQFSSGTIRVTSDGIGGTAATGSNGSDSNGLGNAGNGGRGGSGTGGSARFQIANAANVSTNILLLRSNGIGAAGAIGGNGLAGTGGNGGIGGSGTGGSVFLNLLGGSTLTSGEGSTNYDLLATGIAGAGGSGGDGSGIFVGGNGADGGNAMGGRGSLLIEGNASPVSLNVDIRAVAGAGGAAGANNAATLLTAGKGGNATGGFGQISTNGGTTFIGALTINNTTRGGDGGSANGYGSGGDAGDATGASTQILASGGALTLGNLILSSNATGGSGGNGTSAPFAPSPATNGSNGAAGVLGTNGGNGGDGSAGANGVAGGSGGKGGNGTGGLINVISNSAILTTGSITANANGFGGFGGSGGNGSDGGRGGNGGNGGNGASNFNFNSPNDGGNGGNGGNAGNGGSGGNGGNGGEGGTGFGGSILLRAQDGMLATGNLTLTANGTGALAGVQGGGGLGGSAGLPGNGGLRGESGYGAPGISGQRGAFGTTGASGDQGLTSRLFQPGFGGQINIASQGVGTGSTLTAGIASLTANGLNSQLGLLGDGGDITISNAKGSADQPDVVFERLTAESSGSGFGSINFDAKNANVLSNINIVGSATGDINVRAEGAGELRALGNIVLRADGNFTATHNERATDSATVRAQNVNIIADNVFDAQAGSQILARDSLYVQSLTDRLSAADLTAAAFITAVAGTDLIIGNATTTTPAQQNTLPVFPGLITLQAGLQNDTFVPANLTINGAVTSTGDTLISSGGDIIINSSAVLNSNNRIILNSGDDIFINDGAALTSGIDPIPENGYGATGSLEISAGSINVDAGFPDFVHSIIIGSANLTATNNILSLSAEAIQANTAAFHSGQFSALINNAPASNVTPGDDSGQLSAACVQGNICLGNVTATFDSNFTNATGAINVGPGGGPIGLPNSAKLGGGLQGRNITVRARDSITLGQAGALQGYQASDNLFISALSGDVTIDGPARIRAGIQGIGIFAGGNILGPQADIGASGEVGLYAGGDIDIGAVSTTGNLQTIDSNGNKTNLFRLDVPGSVTIGTLQATASADIRSGGDILLGDVIGADAIRLVSSGDTTVSGSTGTQGDLSVNAGNASSIFNANADGNIFVLAGGNADFGSGHAGLSLDVSAINVTATALTAGGDVTIRSAGTANITSATAGDDILITSGGALTLGLLTTNLTGPDDESDGHRIAITAPTLTLASANSGGTLALTTSAGGLLTGNLTAASNATLSSAGLITTGNITATNGNISQSASGTITNGDLTALLGSVSISNTLGTITTGQIGVGNDFTLNTGSNLSFAGVTVGDDIRITSSGSANLGTLLARGTGTDSEGDGSNIVLNIGGATNVTHAEAVDDFRATAARFETGLNSLITDGDIVITTTGDSLLGNSTAGGFISVSAGGLINFNTLGSGGVTQLFAGNTVTGGAATTGQAFTANGPNGIDIARVSSGGNVTANVGNGDLSVANATAVGSIRYTNSGTGAVIANSAISGGDIGVRSGGTVSVGSLIASGGYNDPQLDGIADGNVFVISTGNASVGNATAAAMLGIQGLTILSSGTLTAGEDILVMTDGRAMLTNLRAGDNIDVIGVGGISLTSATSSGAGRDDRSLSFESGYGGNFFQINSASPDGGDINLASAGAGVSVANLTATDDISVDATGAATVTGLVKTLGTGTTGGASEIIVTAATASITGSDAFNNLLVTTTGDQTLGTAKAGDLIDALASNGSIVFTSLTSGGEISLDAGQVITGGTSLASTNFTAFAGSSLALDDVTATSGAALLTGQFGVAAQNVTAGSNVILRAPGGAVTANRLVSGQDVIVSASSGGISLGSAIATRDVQYTTANNGSISAMSSMAGDDILVSSDGGVMLGTASTTGQFVESGYGTTPDGSNLTITAARSVSLGTATATDNVTATANSGGLTTGDVSAGGALSLTSKGSGSITTGNLSGNAGVTLTSDNLINSGAIASVAGNITVTAVNAVNAGALSASGASSGIAIVSGGDVNLASATAANNIAIIGASLTAPMLSAGNDISATLSGTATLGTVTGTGAFDGTSLATIIAPRGVTIQRTDVRGGVDLNAANGAILVSTDLAATGNVTATGRAIDLTSLSALTLANAMASDGDLRVTAGALTATQGSARGDLRFATTSGDLVAGMLTTGTGIGVSAGGTPGLGDIILTSAGGTTLNGAANAQRNLNVASAGRLSVNGPATGAAVDLRSSDIAIGSAATVGQQGRTTSVTLTNSANGVTTIGGNGVTSGYSISNAEAQRIFAGDIIIVAPRVTASNSGQVSTALNSRAPDVILDALTLTGANGQTGATSGNIGSTGRLRIQTAGKLRTVGAVSLTGLTSANRFQIAADETIEVDAATGSISLRGGSNTLGGTLELTSADVIAASLTNIAAVSAATDTKTISDRLGLNDRAVKDDGYLSANSIVVNVANGFYVQNSGAVSPNLRNFRDRRGLTVGEGGLSIRTTSPIARIVINGRQVSTSAVTGFATGIDFLKLVTFNGNTQGQMSVPTGLFDLDSTINGCAILNPATCQVNFDNGNITRDVINNLTDAERRAAEGDGALPFTLLSIKNVEGLPFQPVIDDPVTGSGNDDLWAIDDDKKCPDGEACPK